MLSDEQYKELQALFDDPTDSISAARETLEQFKSRHGVGSHPIQSGRVYPSAREVPEDTERPPFIEVYSRKWHTHELAVFLPGGFLTYLQMSYGCETEYQRQRRLLGDSEMNKIIATRLRELADSLDRKGGRLAEQGVHYVGDFEYEESGRYVSLKIDMHGVMGG